MYLIYKYFKFVNIFLNDFYFKNKVICRKIYLCLNYLFFNLYYGD